MYATIDCLCDDGPFMKRLESATTGALVHLNDDDLVGELAEDLRFILRWTKLNVVGGRIQKQPNELERKTPIEKMLHVMLETHVK
jgi:hypothetical protein